MSANFILIKRPDGIWLNSNYLEGMGKFEIENGVEGKEVIIRINSRGNIDWTYTISEDCILGVTVGGVERLGGFDRLIVIPSNNGWCELCNSDVTDEDPFPDKIPNRWKIGLGAKLSYGPFRIDKYYYFYRNKVNMTKDDMMNGVRFLTCSHFYASWYKNPVKALILTQKNWKTRNLRPIMFKLEEYDFKTGKVEFCGD